MQTPEQYQAQLDSRHAPSSYQCQIFDFVETGRGNGMVRAVAGSGKTTTIVLAARLIVSDGLFVAFNKAIATELGDALVGTSMVAKTVHSVGYAAVRFANRNLKIQVNADKYRDIVRVYEAEVQGKGTLFGRKLDRVELDALEGDGRKARLPMGAILNLLSLARLSLLDFTADSFNAQLLALLDHHGIDMPEGAEAIVSACVRKAALAGRDLIREVDFTDMVWLPLVHGYKPKRYSWLFVDECQDISAAHLKLLRGCVKRGGRMLFVGDPRQAIYGFAGADAASYENIGKVTKAKPLPLSVCYRCPTSILDAAREYCPEIEAAPGAPEGTVRSIDAEELVGQIREGDMILCRKNAPLISTCFSLIAEGIAATVRGRDIGAGLVKAIRDIAKGTDFADFAAGVDTWLAAQTKVAERRGGGDAAVERRVTALQDKAECVRIVYARSGAETVDQLTDAVEALFSNTRSSVVLSSIHKAKGLENPRVFILGNTQLTFKSQRDWQREQERNLTYVAYTRAQEELVFVDVEI